MSKFVKYTVLQLAIVYGFSWIVAVFFQDLSYSPED